MTWSFTKTDTIADFVSAIYGKGLNFLRTDSATDLIPAIYSIGLKLYKKACYFIKKAALTQVFPSEYT